MRPVFPQQGFCKRGFSESWKCALRSCENLCSGITKPGFSHPGQTFVRSRENPCFQNPCWREPQMLGAASSAADSFPSRSPRHVKLWNRRLRVAVETLREPWTLKPRRKREIRLLFEMISCMCMGSARPGSCFQRVKSPNMQATREIRPEGS